MKRFKELVIGDRIYFWDGSTHAMDIGEITAIYFDIIPFSVSNHKISAIYYRSILYNIMPFLILNEVEVEQSTVHFKAGFYDIIVSTEIDPILEQIKGLTLP